MYQLKPNQSLLDLLRNARIAASDSVSVMVHGELRAHEGKLCVFHEGKLLRALTLPEVVLMAAHDAIPSSLFCILTGVLAQVRPVMYGLRLDYKKAVILSHYSELHRTTGVQNLIVIKYGTYYRRPDYQEIIDALGYRRAAFYSTTEIDRVTLNDLQKYLDNRGKKDAS